MKTIKLVAVILSTVFFTGLLSTARAQDNQLANRLKVSYGDAIYTTSAFGLMDGLIGGIVFQNIDEISSSGHFTLSYQHRSQSGRWSFGGDFGYARFTEKFKDATQTTLSLFTLMASTECYYLKTGIVRLYGTAGLGGSFTSGAAGLAFQFNPIAVRVGNDRIAAFAEVGVGMKGVFNVGLELGF